MNDGVLFDVRDFRHLPDPLNDGVGETAGVALEVTVVDLADANRAIDEEGVFIVSGLEEVEMVVQDGGVEVVLQHDDVRVVEDFIRVLRLEGMEGGERERGPLPWDVIGCR